MEQSPFWEVNRSKARQEIPPFGRTQRFVTYLQVPATSRYSECTKG